ncbi:MAG: hypothetical protein ACK54F_12240 [Planctomycetia bacterium]|jgi:hypothetical protein
MRAHQLPARAVVSCGFLIALAAVAPAARLRAAEAPQTPGLLPAFSDGGSSSREARRQAIDCLPLEQMTEPQRQAVEKALRSTTLYRKLPVQTLTCDTDLFDFALANPESIVDIWRVLGISRLVLDPAGHAQWRLADGYGTVGMLRLLHHARRGHKGTLVFHGRGAYSGPLAPKPLSGTCLLVVQHEPVTPAADGRQRQQIRIDAFLDVDGVGLEIVTRSLQPIIVRSAASNLHEICLFMSTLSEAATENPEGIVHLASRLTRTDPEDRQALATIARAAGKNSPLAAATPADAERLQTELAARWLSTDELDQVHRRR